MNHYEDKESNIINTKDESNKNPYEYKGIIINNTNDEL